PKTSWPNVPRSGRVHSVGYSNPHPTTRLPRATRIVFRKEPLRLSSPRGVQEWCQYPTCRKARIFRSRASTDCTICGGMRSAVSISEKEDIMAKRLEGKRVALLAMDGF